MDIDKLVAIDVHVHAEVSCHQPEDPIMGKYFDASTTYFKADRTRPTIPETIALYRAQNMAFVMFTVDMESATGIKRISNEEIAQFARDNSDVMIPFASIDPHKGKFGALEARRLIEEHGVKGFKFHGIVQDIHPADRIAWPLYEVIDHYKLPAIFHTGHSGMGTGMRHGDGHLLRHDPSLFHAHAPARIFQSSALSTRTSPRASRCRASAPATSRPSRGWR